MDILKLHEFFKGSFETQLRRQEEHEPRISVRNESWPIYESTVMASATANSPLQKNACLRRVRINKEESRATSRNEMTRKTEC